MTFQNTDRLGIAQAMLQFETLGFAFREQPVSDRGIDAHAELMQQGKPNGQLLGIQVKAGSSYLKERTGESIVFRVDAKHVEYWIDHALPVLVCLCDTQLRQTYWRVITDETAESTGKGYKIHVPTAQKLDESSLPKLRDLLTPVVAHNRYTIVKTDDSSHALAKRYAFSVVVNGSANKAEIGAIVRQVTADGAVQNYHRNPQLKRTWGNTRAHAVWTFVYASAEDFVRRNHVCRSLWIDQGLPVNARPMGFSGENVGGEIIVEWNPNHGFLSQFTSDRALTKAEFLNEVGSAAEELRRILPQLQSSLEQLRSESIEERAFLAACEKGLHRIRELYAAATALGFPPFECNDVDERFQSLVACLDNVALYYSEQGREIWDAPSRLSLSHQQVKNAVTLLAEFDYEVRKAR